jgi:hypothetical protein
VHFVKSEREERSCVGSRNYYNTKFLTLQCSLSQPSLLVASFDLQHLQESPQLQSPVQAQLGLVHFFSVSSHCCFYSCLYSYLLVPPPARTRGFPGLSLIGGGDFVVCVGGVSNRLPLETSQPFLHSSKLKNTERFGGEKVAHCRLKQYKSFNQRGNLFVVLLHHYNCCLGLIFGYPPTSTTYIQHHLHRGIRWR